MIFQTSSCMYLIKTDLKPFTTTIHCKEKSWISSFWCLYSWTYKRRSNNKQVPSTSKGLVNLPFIRIRGRKGPETPKTGVSERGSVDGMERQEDTVFLGLQRLAIFSPLLPGHLRQEVLILPCLLDCLHEQLYPVGALKFLENGCNA